MTFNGDARAVADTSIAIALILPGHPRHHAAALTHARYAPALAGHARFESLSVLTRLPDAERLSPSDAARALGRNFPETCWLSAREQHQHFQRLVSAGIQGGAVYDALVGASAVAAALPLLTSDRRAAATYEALGIPVLFVD